MSIPKKSDDLVLRHFTVDQVTSVTASWFDIDSNYVELHGNEVIKYVDFKDMKGKIRALFETEYDIQPVAAYLDRNNAVRVAERFLRLFEELLEVRHDSPIPRENP